MIKLQDYTPEVYYKQSRDFQMIGRLFDVVLNAVKTNADMIYDIPSSDAAGSDLIDLLVLTLGFKHQHNYSVRQLAAICSIFPTILRNKGSLEAIELVCQTLLTAEGIKDSPDVKVEDNTLYIFISPKLKDLSLLRDILDYILPAGISCQIIRAVQISAPAASTTMVDMTKIYFSKQEQAFISALVDLQNNVAGRNRDPRLDKFNQFITEVNGQKEAGIVAEDLEGASANSAVIGSKGNN